MGGTSTERAISLSTGKQIIAALDRGKYIPMALDAAAFGYPVIVKPNAQGSTIGCSVVQNGEALESALDEAFKYDASVLVEQFITGAEITVGLLGNEEPEALSVVEIVAKGGFYDYEA